MKDFRQSMQDVINSKAHFLDPAPMRFEDAFPMVASIRIAYKESGMGVSVFEQDDAEGFAHHITNKVYVPEYIRCSNGLCVHGGYRIAEKIREMVNNKETASSGSIICCGNEGSPKGRRIYRKCYNFIKYKVEIAYKAEDEQ